MGKYHLRMLKRFLLACALGTAFGGTAYANPKPACPWVPLHGRNWNVEAYPPNDGEFVAYGRTVRYVGDCWTKAWIRATTLPSLEAKIRGNMSAPAALMTPVAAAITNDKAKFVVCGRITLAAWIDQPFLWRNDTNDLTVGYGARRQCHFYGIDVP